MKIETKFEVDDEVYFIDFQNIIRKGKISEINIRSNEELSYRILYEEDRLGNIGNTERTEVELYLTKEEVTKVKMNIDKCHLEIRIQNLINDFVNRYKLNNNFINFENGELRFEEIKNEN